MIRCLEGSSRPISQARMFRLAIYEERSAVLFITSTSDPPITVVPSDMVETRSSVGDHYAQCQSRFASSNAFFR